MSLNKPINIASFNQDEFDSWINSFEVVLCDCDGVLWLHDQLFEGTNVVINKLIELGKRVYFVTNNNQTSRAEIATKCLKMNFALDQFSMITSSYVTAQFVKESEIKKVYLIGSKALAQELELVTNVIGNGPDLMTNTLPDYVKAELPRMDREVEAVVVGFDEHFSFPKLFKAVNYLRNPSVKFIATNGDEKIDFPQFTFPDAGPIVAAIENATQKKAVVVGKPSKHVTNIALKHEAHVDPNRFMVIGDRLNTDIQFGKNCNFQTLLVTETGVHNIDDVEKLKIGDENITPVPNYYISHLSKLFERF